MSIPATKSQSIRIIRRKANSVETIVSEIMNNIDEDIVFEIKMMMAAEPDAFEPGDLGHSIADHHLDKYYGKFPQKDFKEIHARLKSYFNKIY